MMINWVEILKEAELSCKGRLSTDFFQTYQHIILCRMMMVDGFWATSEDLRKHTSSDENTSQEFESYVGFHDPRSWWSDDDRIHHLKRKSNCPATLNKLRETAPIRKLLIPYLLGMLIIRLAD